MLPAPILNALFTEQLQQADIAVIEGVMGLYDGYGIDPNYCSSARLSSCPVILLVDGKAVSTSIAATVMGFQHLIRLSTSLALSSIGSTATRTSSC